MKKLIGLISIIGLFSLGSCDNANRGIEDNEEADNNLLDQRDTSEIKEEFNPRGVPAEGLNDHNAIRDDSIEVDKNANEIMANLPSEITEKIMEDENLRKKRLTNSRQYTEGGTNFYELTFDNGERITFDERGNESLSQNPGTNEQGVSP